MISSQFKLQVSLLKDNDCGRVKRIILADVIFLKSKDVSHEKKSERWFYNMPSMIVMKVESSESYGQLEWSRVILPYIFMKY